MSMFYTKTVSNIHSQIINAEDLLHRILRKEEAIGEGRADIDWDSATLGVSVAWRLCD